MRMEDTAKYDDIYTRGESGEFDVPCRENLMDVKKVKKACKDHGVDFKEFLKYGQGRKMMENRRDRE